MANFVYHWGKRYLLSMGNVTKTTDALPTAGYADNGDLPFKLGDDSNDAIRAILVKAGSPCATQYNAARVVDSDATFDYTGSIDQVTGIAVDEDGLLPVKNGSAATIHVTLTENAPEGKTVSSSGSGRIKIHADPVAFTGISASGATLGGMLVYLARDASDNWADGNHASDATDLEHSIPLAWFDLGGSLTGVTAFTVTFGDGIMIEVL